MKQPLENLVAYTLGATEELLPFVHELLADLESLGTSPEAVVSLLRPLDLPTPPRILDLGCGKGAASIALAQSLGASVLGVDGYAPFIEHARAAAQAAGLGELCEFLHGDLREAVRQEKNWDAVLYLAVGDVLGPLDAQVAALRQTVRPGGYMLIDDCYRLSGAQLSLPEYQNLHTREESRALLERHGDRILREDRFPPDEVRAMNARNNTAIAARASALSARHPELAPAFQAYVDRQIEECAILENHVADVHWLLWRED